MDRMRRLACLGLLAAVTLFLAGCPPRMDEHQKLLKDGNDYFDTGDYERAVEAFTKALELRPGEPGVLVNRANARMMLGDNQGALADYDEAVRLDPKFALAYANRGILKDRMGDAEGAIQDYRKALELDPSLGDPPGILKRILYNVPDETIKDRLEYLEAVRAARQGSPADAAGPRNPTE